MDLIQSQVQSLSLNTSNMTPSMSDELSSMKNIGVSKSVADKVDKTLTEFQSVLDSLSVSITNYLASFEVYKRSFFLDTDLLKERMKEKVIMVMNDDI